ncbi:hemolysin-type calcium-binding repeat 2 copies family protein [Asticcacaulis biprosthecium C19]|uniref:Hemolysin-type calcium-binding repeat 2 copies family protein n=1 Tax=Asticcacaulis biprosthecium C19 TaxID=715226 RepID=F4QT14_9CAUL|nr:calcium-binding protein [Asticcacaulis biprosthecium]EGF89884.1 hemolysin-type calcium-binding repeat 2 copies family protein [Asticcacaulis biprosthecium C19]
MAYFNGTPDNDTYTGGAGNDGITGVGGDDVLSGGDGLDTLFGGDGHDWIDGGDGDDIMGGGLGDDTFVVDSAGDTVLEGTNQGIDLVRASVSFSLAGRQIEFVTLTGAAHINATGNGFNNLLTGNSGNNLLDGGAGSDILTGGLGDDTMTGGDGDDIFYVDSAGDLVFENSGEGADMVVSSVSYSLLGTGLEHLTLSGAANLSGKGNQRANVLTGNSGNNALDGDAGNDTLTGGAGDDTYYINSKGDVVVENHYEGHDSIVSSVSYSLFGRAVEDLSLTGAGHLTAKGNSLANALTGNSGNNVLDGSTGKDTMSGGLGNDTYYVNSSYDLVNEASGQGFDRVYSNATFSLAGQFAEALFLTGTGNTDATGNTLGNLLVGNSGNNELDGMGGADTLQGGDGDDTYYLGLDKNDVVIEAVGGGNDTIHTGLRSFTLVGLEVENLRMRGDSREGFGNDLDNWITGNGYNNFMYGGAGNDTLDGGAAHDVMTGGTGDDVYYVESLNDVVVEDADSGIDWVMGGNSHPLFANVENLTLLNDNAVNATGNGLDNRLEGNTGNNVLTGAGGADLFVFLQDSGADRIADLNGAEGDRINISAYTGGVANPAMISQVGADVLIHLGDGNTVLILTDTVDNVAPYIVW